MVRTPFNVKNVYLFFKFLLQKNDSNRNSCFTHTFINRANQISQICLTVAKAFWILLIPIFKIAHVFLLVPEVIFQFSVEVMIFVGGLAQCRKTESLMFHLLLHSNHDMTRD